MSTSNSDEFALHLHLHELQSAAVKSAVHIHLHFAPEVRKRFSPEVRALQMQYEVSIERPSEIAPQLTPVRAQKATSGWICAIGTVAGIPDEIRAMIYHKESDIPIDIKKVHKDSKPGTLDQDTGEWSFDHENSDELNDVWYAPEADSDKNWFVVWAVIGGIGVGRDQRQVKGCLAALTECQPGGGSCSGSESPSPLSASEVSPEILPWRYRIRFLGMFPDLAESVKSSQRMPDASFLLEVDSDNGISAPVWRTPASDRHNVDAILRLTRFGTSYRGQLVVTKFADRILDKPLKWKSDVWNLFQPNILAPSCPGSLVTSKTNALVEPT